MSKFRTIALVAVGAAVFSGLSAAPAQAASWPTPQPQCGSVVPAGSVFVKRVQPPDGLAWEVWRLPSGRLISVYC